MNNLSGKVLESSKIWQSSAILKDYHNVIIL
jgi:hypothetical protein